VIPSAFAALRLITSSNLVGTGPLSLGDGRCIGLALSRSGKFCRRALCQPGPLSALLHPTMPTFCSRSKMRAASLRSKRGSLFPRYLPPH
jgi:hypothetical protein